MSIDTLLITGASSDLAANLIQSLMKNADPPRVLAHFHRSTDRINKLQSSFANQVHPMQADLSQAAGVEQLITQIRSTCEMPDKIVHFAGLKLRLERFPQADSSGFDSDFAVQFSAIARLLREFLPAMARSRTRSKIVFVLSSVTFGVPPKFMSFYTATKYAQLGLMRALASEFAGASVDINAVSPSMVETRFLENVPPKVIEISASQNPQRRNVTAQEVTGAIEFLLSSRSDHLSGANIPVTGGALY